MPYIPNKYENHFNAFEGRYPTPESRFELAAQLAVSDPQVPESERGYTGRFLLASHWGDESPDLRSVAFDIYELRDVLEANVTEPVVVLKSGTLQDIWATPEDDFGDRLDKDVQLDFGFVATSELVHGFNGNTSTHGPHRMGLRPPYLGFGAQVPIMARRTVTVDVLGDTEVVSTPDDSVSNTAVYYGVVPLKFDRNEYIRGRKVQRRTTLIGGAAIALMDQLSLKTKTEELATLAASI